MLEMISIAAASAPLNSDLMANAQSRLDNRPRRLRRVGLAGSAAAGDTAVQLKIGGEVVSIMFNTDTGFPTVQDDMFEVNAMVPPGKQVQAIVTDAPATNPINLALEWL